MPADGRDIELGFEEVERYPQSFMEQQWFPFREGKKDPKNVDLPSEPYKGQDKPTPVNHEQDSLIR